MRGVKGAAFDSGVPMKRGDAVALLIFSIESVWALLWARRQSGDLPGLGDHYFNIPLDSVQEALQSIRTLGYPLFHAAMARAGLGLDAYPLVQMSVLIGGTAILGWGLRLYLQTSSCRKPWRSALP